MLELVDVHKSYQEGESRRAVLRGVNARFDAGQFVAIIGRSGSGKSTLLNVISGIDRPDTGEIRFDGANLSAQSERRRTLVRRSRIGFVFQFFNLIPTLTVGENLRLPLELNRRTAEAPRRVPALLDRVRARRPRSELSRPALRWRAAAGGAGAGARASAVAGARRRADR